MLRGWRGRERGVEEGALRAASVPLGLRASEPAPRERLVFAGRGGGRWDVGRFGAGWALRLRRSRAPARGGRVEGLWLVVGDGWRLLSYLKRGRLGSWLGVAVWASASDGREAPRSSLRKL